MKPRLALSALSALPWPCVLALSLVFTPAAALADTHAGARLSGFGWSLLDLAPDDGIAPWVRFETSRIDASIGLDWFRITAPDHTDVGSDQRTLPGAFFPALDGRLDAPGLVNEAAQSGDPAAHGFTALVRSSATNRVGDGVIDSNANVFLMPVDTRQAITLSPFTQLVWSGRLHMEAGKDARAPGLRHEHSYTTVTMRLRSADTGKVLDAFLGQVDTRKQRGGGTVAQDLPLSLSFANLGDSAARGDLRLSLVAGSRTSVSPIPEPGTWALWAGGLGFACVVAARRRAPPRA